MQVDQCPVNAGPVQRGVVFEDRTNGYWPLVSMIELLQGQDNQRLSAREPTFKCVILHCFVLADVPTSIRMRRTNRV